VKTWGSELIDRVRGLSTDYWYIGTTAHCIRLLDMNWYLMFMWLLELWVGCI